MYSTTPGAEGAVSSRPTQSRQTAKAAARQPLYARKQLRAAGPPRRQTAQAEVDGLLGPQEQDRGDLLVVELAEQAGVVALGEVQAQPGLVGEDRELEPVAEQPGRHPQREQRQHQPAGPGAAGLPRAGVRP